MKLQSTSPEHPAGVPSRQFPFFGWLALLLGVMTVAVYWPATGNGFVNLDDDLYVQANAQVQQGLSWENIGWAFTHTVSCNWHPLTMISHMADCQLYGLNPWGHHLTSLLWHAANTVLLFLLLHRLTGAVWRSAWVAALFALHPLHVESVAWVAERKDVLSTFFGFLCLICYARYVQRAKISTAGSMADRPAGAFLVSRDYWLACACFALGLMCKPMLVTWPFVLLLLDYWPLGRFQTGHARSLIREKIPFFTLAVASSCVTFFVQNEGGATQKLGYFSLMLRCGNAVMSYGRYLSKMFWPADLAAYYPYPKLTLIGGSLLMAAVLAGVSILFWSQRRRYPFLLMGWLWFFGTLVPVIGLVQVGNQAMADRYAYIPSVGLFLLVSWGAYELVRSRRGPALALSVAGAGVLVLCALTTRHQIGYWKDSETLFRHALAVTSDNALAHNNLAAIYVDQGRNKDAIAEFREVLRINPGMAETHLNLGDLLLQAGQTEAGLGEFKTAVAFQTNGSKSCEPLVNALLGYGHTNVAITQLQAAVTAAPTDAELHYRLGNLLFNTGQMDDAAGNFAEAIRLKPDFLEAHNNFASLLLVQGKVDEAIGELQQSIRLQPDSGDTHYNLGTLYLRKGRTDEAAGEFQTVIRLAPDVAPAHYYLGTILIRKGRTDAAIVELQEAIRLKPDYAAAHNKLGIALGSAGHLPGAVAEFQEAVRLKPDYGEAVTNLAIALKMQGNPAR